MDAGFDCVFASNYTVVVAMGECLPDPPAGGACNATEVTAGSAAVAAEENPVGISNDCLECVWARTLRKGSFNITVADVEACGPPVSEKKASGAFTTGAFVAALVATAVAM